MREIAVIVPVYNVEKYIQRSLESLEQQTIFERLKIILNDDCSTDGSYQFCEQFLKKYPEQVRLLRNEENRGVSFTRNKALEYVEEKYVTFFDPDDILAPTAYETMFYLLEKCDADIALTKIEKIFSVAEIATTESFVDYKEKSQHEAIESFYCNKDIDGSVCNKLFRVQNLVNLYFDETLAIGEDALFVYNALRQSQKVILDLSTPKYFYVMRETSAMHTTFLQRKKESSIVIAMMLANEKNAHYRRILKCKLAIDKAQDILFLNSLHISGFEHKKDCQELRRLVMETNIFYYKYFGYKLVVTTFISFFSPKLCYKVLGLVKKYKNVKI